VIRFKTNAQLLHVVFHCFATAPREPDNQDSGRQAPSQEHKFGPNYWVRTLYLSYISF
jgi:hypothetical protein